jgi:hypothetical protein
LASSEGSASGCLSGSVDMWPSARSNVVHGVVCTSPV